MEEDCNACVPNPTRKKKKGEREKVKACRMKQTGKDWGEGSERTCGVMSQVREIRGPMSRRRDRVSGGKWRGWGTYPPMNAEEEDSTCLLSKVDETLLLGAGGRAAWTVPGSYYPTYYSLTHLTYPLLPLFLFSFSPFLPLPSLFTPFFFFSPLASSPSFSFLSSSSTH